MAIYNEILVARYARGIQKLLGLKGPTPMKQLSGELMAVLPIFQGVESRYLEGWNKFGAGKGLPAAAAQQLGFQIRNPSSSGVIAVLEGLQITSEALLGWTISVSTGGSIADATSIQAYANFDGRIGNQTNGSLVVSFQSTTLAPFTVVAENVTAAGVVWNVISTHNQEIPLVPNSAIRVTTETVNLAGHVTFFWRERAFEDSEKT